MFRTLLLWVCLLLVSGAFFAAFTASVRRAFTRARVSSVESLAEVFQITVMRDVTQRVTSVLDGMVLMLNGWSAIPNVEQISLAEAHAYTFSVVGSVPPAQEMLLVRCDG
eukprot:RCo052434